MPTPRVRVKICGITHPEDALLAVEAGADFIGMVFYPPSPRYVSLDLACRIAEAVRSTGKPVGLVAVTVNAPRWLWRALLEEVKVNWIQCHGDEPPHRLQELAGHGFKAIRLKDQSVSDLLAYAAFGPREGPKLLVDAAVPGAYGGTGRLAAWERARVLAQRVPLLLAGGLTPDNVAHAINQVRPWGVDVSSGVEVQPGRKDPKRVAAFVEAVRHALEVEP